MSIQQLEIYRLDIPFKLAFKHSSTERVRTQSLWVEAVADGVVGRGEGCPREYVTNESMVSAGAFFAEHQKAVCEEIDGLEDLASWERRHAATIDDNPAAWCAIELAFLDLFANQKGVPVEDLLSVPPVHGKFHYTAVVGDSGMDAFRAVTTRYRDKGFVDFKLKLWRPPTLPRGRRESSRGWYSHDRRSTSRRNEPLDARGPRCCPCRR